MDQLVKLGAKHIKYVAERKIWNFEQELIWLLYLCQPIEERTKDLEYGRTHKVKHSFNGAWKKATTEMNR